MFSFLLKIVIVAAVIAGGAFYLTQKDPQFISKFASLRQSFSTPSLASLKGVDATSLAQNLSASLDALVTHPDRNSPVVLGVKITNDSLNTLVNVIETLPPEQVDQLKQVICQPASPSAN